MITKTSQAPWVNLVMVTTMSTLAVIVAPTALMIRLRMSGPRRSARALIRRIQWRTMPLCPSVKETKTPMM